MAAVNYVTNTAAADTTVATHFTPNGIPGDTDTVEIANGHTLTNPVGNVFRIGDAASPTTVCLKTSGTGGTGVFVNNGTFRPQANVLQGNANWTCGAGAVYDFYHASTQLTHQISDANTQNKRLIFNGTEGSPCTVTSSLGANGRFTAGGFLGGGIVSATHTDFSNLGSSSNPCMQPRTDFGTSPQVTFADCVFTSCGRIDFPANIQTNNTVTFDRCEFHTPLDSTDRWVTFTGGNNAVGTGARRFADCYIKGVITNAPRFAWTDVVFEQPTATARVLANNIILPSTWERIVTRSTATSAPIVFGGAMPSTIKDTITLDRGSTNNRSVQIDVGQLTSDLTIDGFICHSEGTNAAHDTGDSIGLYSTTAIASTRVVTVQNCIQTVKSNGYQHGKLVSPLPGAGGSLTNLDIDAYHNTMCTADSVETALQAGETQGSNNYGTLYRNVKSNLALGLGTSGGLGAGGGILLSRYGHALQQQDLADPAQVQSNWVQNPNGTSVYRVPSGEAAFFSTAPAGPLYTGDAQCVDIYRSHATWDASLGGAGTIASAMSRLSKKTTRSGAGANDTIANLLAYWRYGFKPQNAAVQAAHDSANGGWIGAMEGIASSNGASPFQRRRRRGWTPRS